MAGLVPAWWASDGELFSWVGAQGVGKSTWALAQEFLLERLIAMESALVGEEGPIGELLAELGEAQPVLQRLAGYEERLFLVKAGRWPRQRMGIHHLRGDTAQADEADVVLILNDKYRAVARPSCRLPAQRGRGFHNWVVFSLEKNRGGVDGVDFELRRRFGHACFDPAGGFLSEQLVDGRLYLTWAPGPVAPTRPLSAP